MSGTSIQTRARETDYVAAALIELARELPRDDAEIHSALVDAARDRDAGGFTNLLLAALHVGRPVDARVLAEGAALFVNADTLIVAAVHCSGDVGDALIRAVRGGRLEIDHQALALALAAWWSLNRANREIPADVVRLGRVLARRPGASIAMPLLVVLDTLADDPHLAELVARWAPPDAKASASDFFDRTIREALDDPLIWVPDEQQPVVLSGYTVRRAASRVGRNEPCPCGSGRKYKRCCFGNDRERLRHSSDVEGLTVEELRENLEPHLDLHRLAGMHPNELARIDAERIDPDLHMMLAHRLTWSREFDALARLFEAVDRPELEDHLLDAIEEAARFGSHEIVRRLVAVRGDDPELRSQLRLDAWMIAEGLRPGPVLERIESDAREAVDDAIASVELAHGLLNGPLAGLGILVARGVLWTASPLDGEVLLETLLEGRDVLGLPPSDPVELEVANRWDGSDDDQRSSETTQETDEQTARELEEKLDEARRLREDLRRRDRDLQRMKRRVKALEAHGGEVEIASGEASGPATGDAGSMVADLRRRLAERKEQLKRRHAERNQLRAELERTRKEADSLRARAVETAQEHRPDEEDKKSEERYLLPEEVAEDQPPRLPEFKRQFDDDLRRVPDKIARAALILIGRLSAGELAAFRGARRLVTSRDVWRQRVGAGHRLLFSTTGDALVVHTLVTRQDFPRVVRSF